MNIFAPDMGITVSSSINGVEQYISLPILNTFDNTLTQNESFIHFHNGSSFGIFLNENHTLLSLDDNIISPVDLSSLKNLSCASIDEQHLNITLESPYSRILENLPFPFFPNCYPDDMIPRFLDISIVVDQSLYQFLNSDLQKVTDYVAIQITKARFLFRNQFNIILRLAYLYISTPNSDDPFPLSSCSWITTDVLQAFASWNKISKTSSKAAHTHLLMNCWPPPGTVGIAYLSTLCEESYNVAITSHISFTNTWLIFAHELGHSMGARHTFGKGGIMDYNNPRVNNTIQFHLDTLPQICTELTEKQYCKYFIKDLDTTNQCGNGILEKDEQCECINMSKDCDLCIECILHPRQDDECSTEKYIVRPPNHPINEPLALDLSLLSDSECCTDRGMFLSADTKCSDGSKVCSIGKCVAMCSMYQFQACDLTEGGCRQPCKGSDFNYPKCTDGIKTQSKKYISYLPNGSICEIKNQRGTCINGNCIIPTNSLTPSTMPTSSPTNPKTTCAPVLNEKRCNMIRSRFECNSLKRCIFKIRANKCGSKCSFFN